MGASLQTGAISRRGRRRSAEPMSEINVTPMVDVMLVLLIIFMVTAPLLTVGVEDTKAALPEVDLPNTEAGPVTPEQAQLSVTVNPAGRIFLQNTEIGFDQLVPKLAAIRDARTGGRVWVRGDDRTPYGNVAKVLARIKEAGFPVTIVTDQMDQP